jgi:hypothetical protein
LCRATELYLFVKTQNTLKKEKEKENIFKSIKNWFEVNPAGGTKADYFLIVCFFVSKPK